jgi:hypothetical protein
LLLFFISMLNKSAKGGTLTNGITIIREIGIIFYIPIKKMQVMKQ